MTPPWPHATASAAIRAVQKTALFRFFRCLAAAVPPEVCGQDDTAGTGPQARPVSMWQVLMYALDATGRTMRICLIILVLALSVVLVFR
jgi:hypothetical protein